MTVKKLWNEFVALEKERDALRDQVSAWIKANAPGGWIDTMRAELDALKAWKEKVEKQEPVAWMSSRNGFICKENKNPDYNLPLYAHPIPAQDDSGAEEDVAQTNARLASHYLNLVNTWLRAIDEALVAAHIGVANAADSYESAKRKLDALIMWHCSVATDPAVNGGWKLVPIVSTQEMDEAGSTHCDGYLSIAQAVWDSMLAAAPKPEVK